MPTVTTIEVKGLKELETELRALGSDMTLKIARSAVNAGAQVIRKRAQQLAPVAAKPHYLYLGKGKKVLVKPGNLKKNIIVRRVRPGQTRYTAESTVTVRSKGKGVVGYPYAEGVFNEFGTVKMSPKPFLRPAFESGKSEAIEAMKKKIRERIDKANKR